MEVPEDFQRRYLNRRKYELANCFQLLENGQFTELERIGHQLKGNGPTFGHPELSVIGKQLETAAIRNDRSTVSRVLKEFKQWVEIHLN